MLCAFIALALELVARRRTPPCVGKGELLCVCGEIFQFHPAQRQHALPLCEVSDKHQTTGHLNSDTLNDAIRCIARDDT